MKKINWFQLLLIVMSTELVGILGSIFSGNIGQIYASFIKPPLSPPGWLFGIVWPVLYLLMGVAAYCVYRTPPSYARKRALMLYWVQLFVNFLWPIVFFRFELFWVAAAIILLLDALVALTALRFYQIKPVAGYLMIPYLLWILFATYLNIGIAILNQSNRF
jgi:benzodiazapine receptor